MIWKGHGGFAILIVFLAFMLPVWLLPEGSNGIWAMAAILGVGGVLLWLVVGAAEKHGEFLGHPAGWVWYIPTKYWAYIFLITAVGLGIFSMRGA